MRNLKKPLLIFCLLLFFLPSKADVIYAPVTHMGIVVSIEGIAKIPSGIKYG
jgi:hypothetical protein